jgi:hypothetical protein
VNLIGYSDYARLEVQMLVATSPLARLHFVQSLHNACAQSCQATAINEMTWTQFVRKAHHLVFKPR